VGAGFMGEQGAEFLHIPLHNLEGQYANILNELERHEQNF